MATETHSDPPTDPTATPTFLRWPPPGLERMQGDLWRVASRGALSGALLVLPLLFVVAREPEFASLGPFADAWWITLILAAVGLGFALDALTTTGRIFGRVSRALDAGYDLRTISFVLADLRRDMGFLLQGGRHFGMIDQRERQVVAGLRVVSVVLHAVAGLWLPVALSVGLLMSSRGMIDHRALWMLTIVPSVLLFLLGGAAGATEDGRVRRARKKWHQGPWASDLVPGEIELWRADLSAFDGEARTGPRQAGSPPWVRHLSVLIGAIAVVVAVPILTLLPASSIGPVVATVGIPNFSQAQARAARVEAFRPYRVAFDESMTPQDAGILLQTLIYVGESRATPAGELAPARRIEAPWIEASEVRNPIGAEPHRWGEMIFNTVLDDPSQEVLDYLAKIAAHEARPDFSRLSRAAEIDVAVGRWPNPFPPEVTMVDVPIPRFGGLRTSAYAHIGAAAYELSQGREAQAEQMIREVISLGLLLGDEAPMLIENLIGHMIARTGGVALKSFYEATGKDVQAARIEELDAVATLAADRIPTRPPAGVEAFVRSMPATVTNAKGLRGLRWESFVLTTTLTPCLNLNRIVFGPDASYEQFIEDAHASLVRWPSEEPLFALAQDGYLGGVRNQPAGLIGRFLAISMRSGEGACGPIVSRLQALSEIF